MDALWNALFEDRHIVLNDSDEIETPVQVFTRSVSGGGLAKSSWDDELGGGLESQPFDKRAAETKSIFHKGTVGHRLGITRVEEKQIGEDRWSYAYRGDELVDARIVSSLF